MLEKTRITQTDELDKTMLCARWLVHQFEAIECESIAKIFQKAVNDADAWIHNMVIKGDLPKECFEPIKAEEISLLHNILVRYASINNPDLRREILDQMMENTEEIKQYNS